VPHHTAEQKQETIRARVRLILARNPEARNSDGYLQWLYGRQYLNLKLPYLDFVKLRSLNFDSLARGRRYWQNQKGLFPPTDPKVAEARQRKSEAMKAAYGAN
jgi:hypothetical protein